MTYLHRIGNTSEPGQTAFGEGAECAMCQKRHVLSPSSPDVHAAPKLFEVYDCILDDLRDKISKQRSGQSVSLLNSLKQELLPKNSKLQFVLH